MPQLKISTSDFELRSQWRCSTGSNGTRFIVEGPTTDSKTVAFAYSLPTGAVVNSVKVFATIGSPISGAAINTANNVSFVGEYLTECCAEQELSGFSATEESYSVAFRFKAVGYVFNDSNYHMSMLAYSNVYLLIDYTVPNSEWDMEVSEVFAGSSVKIQLEPYDSSCTHELLLQFGSLNETYAIAAGVTSYEVQIPYSWLEQIPQATSGVAIVRLKTLVDGVELGLSESRLLTIVCPEDIVPTIGTVTAEIIDPVWNLCVQRYSSIKFVATGCSGAYGSTLEFGQASATPHVGYWSAAIGETCEFVIPDKITVAGTVTVDLTLVDSRGRKATKSVSFVVHEYSNPSIIDTMQKRADDSGVADAQGTYATARCYYTYTKIATNTVTVDIYYRPAGTTEWELGMTGHFNSGVTAIFAGDLDLATVYELMYVVSDDLGSSIAYRTIGTAYAFMKWMPQTDAIGFGCIPRAGKMFEVGADWNVYAYGKDIRSYAPMRNYVDNGYFLQPVNQRNFDSEVAPLGETIMYLDRWEIVGFGQNVTIESEPGFGVHMTGNSTEEYIEIRQRFEDYSNMAGQEYTIEFCVNDMEYAYSFVMGECSSGYGMAGLTFYSTDVAHIALRNNTKTRITIQWIALYKGRLSVEQLPVYVPKGYGAELAECSRYFGRVGSTVSSWIAAQPYVGMFLNSTYIRVNIPLLNTLRRVPDVLYGAWDVAAEPEFAYKLYKFDGTPIEFQEVQYSTNQNGELLVLLTVDEAVGGSQGLPVVLFVQTALHLSADV